jgi:threonine aldolase
LVRINLLSCQSTGEFSKGFRAHAITRRFTHCAFSANGSNKQLSPANEPIVKLFGDGEFYDGLPYLEQLQLANNKLSIKVDRYGAGGAVEELEKKFEAFTGKEKAIYMPSGTMANHLPSPC